MEGVWGHLDLRKSVDLYFQEILYLAYQILTQLRKNLINIHKLTTHPRFILICLCQLNLRWYETISAQFLHVGGPHRTNNILSLPLCKKNLPTTMGQGRRFSQILF